MKQDDIARMIEEIKKSFATMQGVQPMTPVGQAFTMRFKVQPKSKYQFSRAKWYKADFYYTDFDAIVNWCTEQFGPHPKHPDAWSRWKHNGQDRVFFRDEKDYVLFCLRWS